ncbi:hypothetical protein [Streptomyces prasinus]
MVMKVYSAEFKADAVALYLSDSMRRPAVPHRDSMTLVQAI